MLSIWLVARIGFRSWDHESHDWLVVWNIFYFPIYWVANHPNWRSYFSEGWPNHQPDDDQYLWQKYAEIICRSHAQVTLVLQKLHSALMFRLKSQISRGTPTTLRWRPLLLTARTRQPMPPSQSRPGRGALRPDRCHRLPSPRGSPLSGVCLPGHRGPAPRHHAQHCHWMVTDEAVGDRFSTSVDFLICLTSVLFFPLVFLVFLIYRWKCWILIPSILFLPSIGRTCVTLHGGSFDDAWWYPGSGCSRESGVANFKILLCCYTTWRCWSQKSWDFCKHDINFTNCSFFESNQQVVRVRGNVQLLSSSKRHEDPDYPTNPGMTFLGTFQWWCLTPCGRPISAGVEVPLTWECQCQIKCIVPYPYRNWVNLIPYPYHIHTDPYFPLLRLTQFRSLCPVVFTMCFAGAKLLWSSQRQPTTEGAIAVLRKQLHGAHPTLGCTLAICRDNMLARMSRWPALTTHWLGWFCHDVFTSITSAFQCAEKACTSQEMPPISRKFFTTKETCITDFDSTCSVCIVHIVLQTCHSLGLAAKHLCYQKKIVSSCFRSSPLAS